MAFPGKMENRCSEEADIMIIVIGALSSSYARAWRQKRSEIDSRPKNPVEKRGQEPEGGIEIACYWEHRAMLNILAPYFLLLFPKTAEILL
jgi:hypothetical protein